MVRLLMVEAGAAVRSMDPMKKEKKENAFFNKYMGCLEEIGDNQFVEESVLETMRCGYKNVEDGQQPHAALAEV